MSTETEITEMALATVEGVIDALAPLAFEPVVVAVDGSEPFACFEFGDGRVIELTAKLKMFCDCCDLDGTHDHTNCEHPCCPNDD